MNIRAIAQRLLQTQPPGRMSLINTRVMLETGVNLREVTPEQENNPRTTAMVEDVLRQMGVGW